MTNWITRFNARTTDELQDATVQMSATVATAAEALGFQELNYTSFDHLDDPNRRRGLIEGWLRPVQPGDLVVIQFPLWEQLAFQAEAIDYLHDMDDVKLIATVDAVPTWLYADDTQPTVRQTDFWLQQLRKFDLLIVANDKQAQRLRQDNVTLPMVTVQVRDYPYSGPLQAKRFRKQLNYISEQAVTGLDYRGATPLTLYNTTVAETVAKQASVQHVTGMTLDYLVATVADGFGLVNVANIQEASTPNDVRNQQYDNSLMLSQYLAAGMPVVIGDASAQAALVQEHHLGIVIHDLNDIDEALSQVTADDYQAMLTAIAPWQRLMTTAYFMKRALLAAMSQVNLGIDHFLLPRN